MPTLQPETPELAAEDPEAPPVQATEAEENSTNQHTPENSVVLTPEEIRARLAEVGVTDGSDTIVYSDSGNHSAQALAAMEIAGIHGVRHYVGGWSQWSADNTNPVERKVPVGSLQS